MAAETVLLDTNFLVAATDPKVPTLLTLNVRDFRRFGAYIELRTLVSI